LAQTWRLLAAHFAGNPAVLGYDLMNEPVRNEPGEVCGSCNWHSIAQALVKAIRAVDGNHLIFVEGPNYSLASHWPVENGPTPFISDQVSPVRIVYSPHVFLDADNDSVYDGPGEAQGPASDWRHYVRDRLLPAIRWSLKNDVPIFFGETGVPCTAGWANVLEEVYRTYFEPLRLSAAVWHYIDPQHCPLGACPLNIAACQAAHQAQVLQRFPGGAYHSWSAFALSPRLFVIYDDVKVAPWESGMGYWGNVSVDFCAAGPVFEGQCAISVQYYYNYDGVKFRHHYGLDSSYIASLQFWIYLEGSGQQDFKIFTTSPRADCSPGAEPEYPLFYEERHRLKEYLANPEPGRWHEVRVPIRDVTSRSNPIMNGIAFQNMGAGQTVFYLDKVALLPNELAAVFRDLYSGVQLVGYPTPALKPAGGVFGSDPAVARSPTGDTVAAARDQYGSVWVNTFDVHTQSWSSWALAGGITQGAPAIAAAPDRRIYIAARDLWNSYWLLTYEPGGGFGSWIPLAGIFSTDPAMAACADGSLYIIGKDTWNSLWSGRYIPGTGFQGWQWGMGIVKGKPSVACGTDGAAYVAARDSWDSLWMARVSGNSWTGWHYGGGIMSADPQAASAGAGVIYAVIRDPWGGIWYRGFTEGTTAGWHDWVNTKGVLQDVSPAALAEELYIAGRDANGGIWWYRATGNQWTWIGHQGLAAGPLAAAPR
jgi:hypothetical protein